MNTKQVIEEAAQEIHAPSVKRLEYERMKYIITFTTDEELSPGNLDHLISILQNPNSRNFINIREEQ